MGQTHPIPPLPDTLPMVTIQLPVYTNATWSERLNRRRLPDGLSPRPSEIQVLDDSTDDTSEILRGRIASLQREGFFKSNIGTASIVRIQAGALAAGLARARGESCHFCPTFCRAGFLQKTLPHFTTRRSAMVQRAGDT